MCYFNENKIGLPKIILFESQYTDSFLNSTFVKFFIWIFFFMRNNNFSQRQFILFHLKLHGSIKNIQTCDLLG